MNREFFDESYKRNDFNMIQYCQTRLGVYSHHIFVNFLVTIHFICVKLAIGMYYSILK